MEFGINLRFFPQESMVRFLIEPLRPLLDAVNAWTKYPMRHHQMVLITLLMRRVLGLSKAVIAFNLENTRSTAARNGLCNLSDMSSTSLLSCLLPISMR